MSLYADLIAIAKGDRSVAQRRLKAFSDYADGLTRPEPFPYDPARLARAVEGQADWAMVSVLVGDVRGVLGLVVGQTAERRSGLFHMPASAADHEGRQRLRWLNAAVCREDRGLRGDLTLDPERAVPAGEYLGSHPVLRRLLRLACGHGIRDRADTDDGLRHRADRHSHGQDNSSDHAFTVLRNPLQFNGKSPQ